MVTTMTTPSPRGPDPLINEVRTIRRKLVEKYDNDLARLAAHLRRVHADYENRTGEFANLPRHIRQEPFHTMTPSVRDLKRAEFQPLQRKPRTRRRRQP